MNINLPKVYRTAIYVRISKEMQAMPLSTADAKCSMENSCIGRAEEKRESESIVNQKDLLLEYAKNRPDIQICSIRVDDGYSGVDFQRPAFVQMMEDIRKGSIDCVLVKDLSRFGRNYIETGRYIERIFPMLGVRFIAVNDNLDTLEAASMNHIMIPFKNLINDAYCRDISIKIRSHLEVKRKKGEYLGAFALYGYKKSQENRHQLVIDEVAAQVVRNIFLWKRSGMNPKAIAVKLNQEGILSPSAYKKSVGVCSNKGSQTGTATIWNSVSIGRILSNEMYTGVLIQGRQGTINYKVRKRVEQKESKWIRVENAHEGIVSEQEFQLVQQLLRRDTRTSPGQQNLYPFSGMIFCGDCGSSMIRKNIPSKRTADNNQKVYTYLVCSRNKNRQGCSSHSIEERKLEQMVLEQLPNYFEQEKLLWSVEVEERLSEELGDIPKLTRETAVQWIDRILVYNQKRIEIMFR